MNDTDPLLVLNRLRVVLDVLLVPDVLDKLLSLREELGNEDGLLNRYKYLSEHAVEKENCRYTKMAKHYFLAEHGDNVILLINWLHENFTAKL